MKKVAKFAFPMAISGFVDFESNLDYVNHYCVNFIDALHSNKCFTKKVHQIVSFSLISADKDGILKIEILMVVKILGHSFSKL